MQLNPMASGEEEPLRVSPFSHTLFSPWYFQRVRITAITVREEEIGEVASTLQGLKPNLFLFLTARLKPVP